MKKIQIFISIFIILFGLFTPAFHAQAQNPNGGLCYSRQTKTVNTNYSSVQDCENRDKEFKAYRWNGTSCVRPDGSISPIDKEGCDAATAGKFGYYWVPDKPAETLTPVETTLKIDPSYHFLEPLPGCKEGTEGCENGKLVTFNPGGEGKFGQYLNFAITLFIGLCAVAAVVMLVIAGIEYSSSELISTKAAAIERIKGAIFGLVLALTSWTILYTVNPDLLNSDVEVGRVTLELIMQEFKVNASVTPDGFEYYPTTATINFKGNSCSVPPDQNNPCHPSQLTGSCFANNAEDFSKICMQESRGNAVKSGSDLLNNGKGPSYSAGIWQINLTVHTVKDPSTGQVLDCPSAFTGRCGRDKSGKTTLNGPKIGNCSVSIKSGKEGLYNKCMSAVMNPKSNREAACKAMSENKRPPFGPWITSAKKCGVVK